MDGASTLHRFVRTPSLLGHALTPVPAAERQSPPPAPAVRVVRGSEAFRKGRAAPGYPGPHHPHPRPWRIPRPLPGAPLRPQSKGSRLGRGMEGCGTQTRSRNESVHLLLPRTKPEG